MRYDIRYKGKYLNKYNDYYHNKIYPGYLSWSSKKTEKYTLSQIRFILKIIKKYYSTRKKIHFNGRIIGKRCVISQ